MKQDIILAFRSLFKKGRNNAIKILSLSVGLALGFVLIAKVHFEQTFDNFYPDGERTYQITSNFKLPSMEEPQNYGQVSGGVAVGMREDIPEVEAATRFTGIYEGVFYDDDKRTYEGSFILGDSCLFDVLPRPILVGNDKEILSRPMYAMVSSRIAEMMGGNVIGRTITLDSYPGRVITIGGVFEEIPENTHYRYDVVVSMPSISNFMGDGSMNWLGNDRYLGYVRLLKGVDYTSLDKAIVEMQERRQPMEQLREMGLTLTYQLKPLLSLHTDNDDTKRMSLLLSLLAFALLFTAVMNYILVAISTLVGRTKEVGVYKCYGASGRNITSIMLTETSVHLFISIVLAVLFVLAFQSSVKDLIGTSINALFSPASCLLLLGVCLLTYLVAGIIPAQLFARIPVAAAFRTHKESRRVWKLGLLFIQFIGCAFLVTLLVVIGRQYRLMINDNPGYNYENVLYAKVNGVDGEKRQQAVDELSRISGIKMIATAERLPFESLSGNNVSLPGKEGDLFNFGDMELVDENYLGLMEIPVVEGVGFDNNTAENEIIVSKSFAEKFCSLTETDNIIGQDVILSYWGSRRIIGVYDNIRIQSVANSDERPTLMLYSKTARNVIMIKAHQLSSELIQQVQATLEHSMPNKHIVITPYKDEMINLYTDSRKFRDSVMIGGIITLIISLIGLIGYTNDEINRRRAEIAVRKINGATMKNIQGLFIKDVARIAIPSVVFGAIAAYFTAVKWQEQFAEKADLGLIIFVGCAVFVATIVLFVVSIDCYRVANQNPVESLRN